MTTSSGACTPDQNAQRIPLVALEELSVKLGGSEILTDINLQFGEDVVALVGPNGSGKSTLLRALATLIPISGGRIEVQGISPVGIRDARRFRELVGYMPQRPSFAKDFSVEEALRYAAWLYGVPSAERPSRVADMLERLDLASVSKARLGTLSGGTLQRVHIGQAAIHKPPVLLLDEPTTGVDAKHRAELRALLAELAVGRLLIMSTHLSDDIALLARQVVALHSGRVAFEGDTDALESYVSDDRGDRRSRIDAALTALGDSPWQ